jgi:hypothetical protein
MQCPTCHRDYIAVCMPCAMLAHADAAEQAAAQASPADADQHRADAADYRTMAHQHGTWLDRLAAQLRGEEPNQ